MTIKKAIEIVEADHKWRRGDDPRCNPPHDDTAVHDATICLLNTARKAVSLRNNKQKQ